MFLCKTRSLRVQQYKCECYRKSTEEKREKKLSEKELENKAEPVDVGKDKLIEEEKVAIGKVSSTLDLNTNSMQSMVHSSILRLKI